MGVPWMTVEEASQAIPPAFSRFIARAWLRDAWKESKTGWSGLVMRRRKMSNE